MVTLTTGVMAPGCCVVTSRSFLSGSLSVVEDRLWELGWLDSPGITRSSLVAAIEVRAGRTVQEKVCSLLMAALTRRLRVGACELEALVEALVAYDGVPQHLVVAASRWIRRRRMEVHQGPSFLGQWAEIFALTAISSALHTPQRAVACLAEGVARVEVVRLVDGGQSVAESAVLANRTLLCTLGSILAAGNHRPVSSSHSSRAVAESATVDSGYSQQVGSPTN